MSDYYYLGHVQLDKLFTDSEAKLSRAKAEAKSKDSIARSKALKRNGNKPLRTMWEDWENRLRSYHQQEIHEDTTRSDEQKTTLSGMPQVGDGSPTTQALCVCQKGLATAFSVLCARCLARRRRAALLGAKNR